MISAEFLQMDGTDFFFAFEQKFYVTSQKIVFESQLKSLDLYHRLPFVVIGAPAFDQPVFDAGLKGWRSPQFHRIFGHHVVMAVHEHRVSLGIDDFFSVHNGMPLGLKNLGFVHSRRE